jgi:hypothetical protein
MMETERVELRGDREWNKENLQGQSAGRYVVYPTTYYRPLTVAASAVRSRRGQNLPSANLYPHLVITDKY